MAGRPFSGYELDGMVALKFELGCSCSLHTRLRVQARRPASSGPSREALSGSPSKSPPRPLILRPLLPISWATRHSAPPSNNAAGICRRFFRACRIYLQAIPRKALENPRRQHSACVHKKRFAPKRCQGVQKFMQDLIQVFFCSRHKIFSKNNICRDRKYQLPPTSGVSQLGFLKIMVAPSYPQEGPCSI